MVGHFDLTTSETWKLILLYRCRLAADSHDLVFSESDGQLD